MQVTEKQNIKTKSIDNLPIVDAINLLYSVEEDLFPSFTASKKKQISIFIKYLISFLKKDSSKIILHGSGTSGRFAILIANEYNKIFGTNKLCGIISGGPSAFVKSKEGSEDDVLENITFLEKEIKNTKNTLYLGISCSGTSSGVLGSLHFLKSLKNKNIKSGLFFLNKLSSIPKSKLLSYYDIPAYKIIKETDFLINPIVGPEAISGSTRLKGGSITQMVLDISFYIAAVKLGCIKGKRKQSIESMIDYLLNKYSKNYFSLKKYLPTLEPLIISANKSLKNNSNIYYISDKKTSPVSLIDASECLPTFGVDFKTVRGFTEKGDYKSIFTNKQIKLIGSSFIKKHSLSIDVKSIKKNDTLIFIFYKKPSKEMLFLINNIPSENKYVISINSTSNIKNNIKIFVNEENNFGFIKTSLKYLLNIITTETFIYSGKTWGNLMIDLKLSNNKLIDRAISRIILPIVNNYRVVSREEIISHLNKNTSFFLKKAFPKDQLLDSKVYFKVDNLVSITILTLLKNSYADAYKKIKLKRPLKSFIK